MLSFRFYIDKTRKLVYYTAMTVIQERRKSLWNTIHRCQSICRVANLIKRDIVTGKRELGEKLPSVRELAVSYTINPNTVSRVYKELETEGVCFTRRGMGTFVTEDSEKVKNMKEEMAGTLIHEFLEGMQQLGFTKTDVIRILKKKEESGE